MTSVIFITVILGYLVLISLFIYGFDKAPEFRLRDMDSKTKFSIIVPYRNEGARLPQLLRSIYSLNYPKSLFEVLLVNDESEDDSVAVIKSFIAAQNKHEKNATAVSLIENRRYSTSPKKDAITTAVSHAKYDWIITTDADCIVPRYWLSAYDEYIQTSKTDYVFGPVAYTHENSFLARFQALEVLSLQGATIGAYGLHRPFLSNGANMAYKATLFNQYNGYRGNAHIASGDDLFLLDKFQKSDVSKIGYVKNSNAVVNTFPESSVSALIQQRLRWASKTGKSKSMVLKCVGILIFLGNLVSVFLIPSVIFNLITERTALLLFAIKFCVDLLLIFKASRFLGKEFLLISYFSSSLIYPFFSTYIAVRSLFGSFYWKGRQFKH